jgi:hypothetical protein
MIDKNANLAILRIELTLLDDRGQSFAGDGCGRDPNPRQFKNVCGVLVFAARIH